MLKIKYLAYSILLLLFVLLITMISSTNTSPTPPLAGHEVAGCNVSKLEEGAVHKCMGVIVYKKTASDFKTHEKYSAFLENSSLSSEAIKDSYLIFHDLAPIKRCELEFSQESNPFLSKIGITEKYPHFYEQCDWRTWDIYGRLFKQENYPLETNLKPAKVHWLSDHEFVVLD